MKRINVLGTGKSLEKYVHSGDITIGVNDINKYFEVDYLVCIDLPERFQKERKDVIINSNPKKFFSNLDEWKSFVNNYEKIKMDKFPGCLDGLDATDIISYSISSTYVATVMAYKMGAKEIVMYGVDFKNHSHLSQDLQLKTSLKHYGNLYAALKQRGVNLYVCSDYSELSKIIPVAQLVIEAPSD